MGPSLATQAAATGSALTRARGRRRPFASWGIVVGTTILVLLIAAGFFAPLPYDPLAPDATRMMQAPSAAHLMGTDSSGFDVFSRVIYSAQRDLPLALIGVLVSILIGVPLGLVSGGRNRVGEWLMRALELFQAFPLIVLAIVIVQVSGNRIENVVLALAVVNVPRFMRLVRAEVLTIRESRFVEAAVATGSSPARVMFRHILPNVPGVILVQSSLAAANGLITVATLNFVGLGANPPIPSWGSMIREGSSHLHQGAWWLVVFPGLAVFVSVLAFNMIADNIERLTGVGER